VGVSVGEGSQHLLEGRLQRPPCGGGGVVEGSGGEGHGHPRCAGGEMLVGLGGADQALIEQRDDMRVAQAGGDADLRPDGAGELRFAGALEGQELDGDLSRRRRVPGTPDLGGAADADAVLQDVVAETFHPSSRDAPCQSMPDSPRPRCPGVTGGRKSNPCTCRHGVRKTASDGRCRPRPSTTCCCRWRRSRTISGGRGATSDDRGGTAAGDPPRADGGALAGHAGLRLGGGLRRGRRPCEPRGPVGSGRHRVSLHGVLAPLDPAGPYGRAATAPAVGSPPTGACPCPTDSPTPTSARASTKGT